MKNETHDREVKFKDVLKLFKHLERDSLFRAGARTFPHLFDFLFVFLVLLRAVFSLAY